MGFGQMRKTLGEGLFTSEEPVHMRHRRMIQPGFHHTKLDAYAEKISLITREHVDSLRDGGVIDLHEVMSSLTLDIVSQSVFGINTRSMSDTIRQAVDESMDTVRLTLPFTKGTSKMTGPQELRSMASDILKSKDWSNEDNFISLLLSLKDDDGVGFTDEEILDETISILLGGYETTGSALVWALRWLATRPDVRKELEVEADTRSWIGTSGDTPTIMDTADAPIAHAIINETLRLSCPVWTTPRKAVEDVTIGNVEIPAGAHVMISQHVTHRDDRVFSDPDKWDPYRWKDLNPQALPRGSYFPFGAGNRLCIGKQFALSEAAIILLEIARRWQLDPVKKKFPKGKARLLYRPAKTVEMKVVQR